MDYKLPYKQKSETGSSNAYPDVNSLLSASFHAAANHHNKIPPLKRSASAVSTAQEVMLCPFAISSLTLQNV